MKILLNLAHTFYFFVLVGMKKQLLVCLFLFFVCVGLGQSLDIHKRSVYYPHTKQLKERFEYYYDYWAEQDVKHGRYSTWTKSGIVSKECLYENNHIVGEEKYFDKKGILIKMCNWRAGKKEAESYFYPDISLKKQIIYTAKEHISSITEYYPSGKCKLKRTYLEGQKPSVIEYNSNGEEKVKKKVEKEKKQKPPIIKSNPKEEEKKTKVEKEKKK